MTKTARRTVEIVNARGLHARASAKFVKAAAQYDAEIKVTRDGQTVDAQSIMGLMMLGAGVQAARIDHLHRAGDGRAPHFSPAST